MALIPDDDWQKGPAHIADLIANIQRQFSQESESTRKPPPVTEDQKTAMIQRVALNRDALVLLASGLIEQISEFREKARGMNHLDPDFKSELLDHLDTLAQHLDVLLENLPFPENEISPEKASALVGWLREFKPLMRAETAKYISPKNLTEAGIPTAIVLGSTAIGAMLGSPVSGAIIGGIITNRMQQAKAAGEFLKPAPPSDVADD